jgi:hypothetical protein
MLPATKVLGVCFRGREGVRRNGQRAWVKLAVFEFRPSVGFFFVCCPGKPSLSLSLTQGGAEVGCAWIPPVLSREERG